MDDELITDQTAAKNIRSDITTSIHKIDSQLDGEITRQPESSTSVETVKPYKGTARLWTLTIKPGTCEELPKAGSVLHSETICSLIGCLEQPDSDNSYLHFHTFNKTSKAVRQNQVLEMVKEQLPGTIPIYCQKARDVSGLVKYIMKAQPELDTKLFRQKVTKEMHLEKKTLKLDDDVKDEKTTERLEKIMMEIQLQKKDKPTWAQWFREVRDHVGLSEAVKEKSVIMEFLNQWPAYEKEESKMIDDIAEVFKHHFSQSTEEKINVEYIADKLISLFGNATYFVPNDIELNQQADRMMYTMCVMFLTSVVTRPRHYNCKGLWISGPPGVGKTLLSRFIGRNQIRCKEIAGDAHGVGRFNTTYDHEVLIIDEATKKTVSSDCNLRTINSILDGGITTVKSFGTTVDIEPLWVVVTSNVQLDNLTLNDQDDSLTTTEPHSMKRRFVEINLPDERDTEMFDILSSTMVRNNAPLIIKTMIMSCGDPSSFSEEVKKLYNFVKDTKVYYINKLTNVVEMSD